MPCNSKSAISVSVSLLFFLAAVTAGWTQDQAIYTDTLQNGWLDWGWTQINYKNTSPVHSGAMSVSVTITQGWQGIYIAHNAFNCSTYSNQIGRASCRESV